MTALKIVGSVVGGIAVVILIGGMFLSDQVTVRRSLVIAAEPVAIHPHLTTLREWPEWSAWNLKEDPKAVFSFEGPESGVGAKWIWKDGDKFKNGWLEILESDAAKGVRYTLMADGVPVNGEIEFSSERNGTRLTWTDSAAFGMGPLGGWMKLFLGGMVDREQGGNQERSLNGLKQLVENS